MRRVAVVPGPSGLSWADLITPELAARGYHQVNPEAVVEMPQPRKGCALPALILFVIAGAPLYVIWQIARAVWS